MKEIREEELKNALEKSMRHEREITALLKGSRAVLESHDFPATARLIFNCCKEIIGASSGYVALLSKDGSENEVLFLDPGGLPCTVDPSLPMPIRGLREIPYRTGEVAYDNDFHDSDWMKFMPEGHVRLENVMFAPLTIEGKTVGLLGLGNKPGGFTEDDARLARAFGEYAALALHNSRMLESLEGSAERFQSVVQTAKDAIISINCQGIITFWNLAAASMFGYSSEDAIGKNLAFIMPERYREAHIQAMIKASANKKLSGDRKAVELSGLRKDGSEFPLELSIALWKSKDNIFFTGILRDITERKQAEKALQKAKDGLEVEVKKRTSELNDTNLKLMEEIEENKMAREQISASLKEKETLLSEVHHRVKNNLQIILSLLSLQSNATKDPKYSAMLNDSKNRIRSMALIHEKLYASKDLARINFRDYLKDLVQGLFRSYESISDRIGLKIDIGDIFLEIETAIPCGLIVNEILSNSLRHAFPEGRKGEIRIDLREIEGPEYDLVVCDNGIGLPKGMDVRNAGSMGLQLIMNLSENQLKGRVEVHNDVGTEFRIRFKENQYKKRI